MGVQGRVWGLEFWARRKRVFGVTVRGKEMWVLSFFGRLGSFVLCGSGYWPLLCALLLLAGPGCRERCNVTSEHCNVTSEAGTWHVSAVS